MIKSYRLHNYKAFSDSHDINLSPFSILLGRNSSGKTSLVNALLLLKQTLEEEAVGSTERSPQLILNGPIIESGNYEDIIHKHDSTKELSVTFQMEFIKNEVDEFDYYSKYEPLISIDIPRLNYRSRGFYPRFRLRESRSDLPKKFSSEIKMTFGSEGVFGPGIVQLEIKALNIGSAVFTRSSGDTRKKHWRFFTRNLPKKCLDIYFGHRGFFPIIAKRDSEYKKISRTNKKNVRQFLDIANLSFADISAFLNSINIVGPFRTPPSRRYTFAGPGSASTGITGEQAINLLITESLTKPKGKRLLNESVSYWLQKIGLARSIDVTSLIKNSNLFEINLLNAGFKGKTNFADVGFGVSQILPVLVQGLLMEKNGVFIVQQPEIHLHPDAQANLVDFFIFLSSVGVKCIVETHSEYFLVRLRRRLAENKVITKTIEQKLGLHSKKLDKSEVSINFVHEDGGRGNFVTHIPINSDFQLENLPSGFMNQSVEDRMNIMRVISK